MNARPAKRARRTLPRFLVDLAEQVEREQLEHERRLAKVPTGTPIPPEIAEQLEAHVREALALQLGAKVSHLVWRGWSVDELVGECLAWCVRRWRFRPYNPARGRLGAWVYVVTRSRMGHLVDRTPQPRVSGRCDVHARAWSSNSGGNQPSMRWGEAPPDRTWIRGRALRELRAAGNAPDGVGGRWRRCTHVSRSVSPGDGGSR